MTITDYTLQLLHMQNMIDRADACYHNGASVMTDAEYDILKKRLHDLSPTDERFKRVGAPVPTNTSLVKRKHLTFMGSLSNAMTPDEYNKWHTNMTGHVLTAMPKFDGLSVELQYNMGILEYAVTRGDGYEGEDITANALRFIGVPRQLPSKVTGQIRGETVLHIDEWLKLDPDKESNARNICAGIARRKDGNNSHCLRFYPFSMDGDWEAPGQRYRPKSHLEMVQAFRSMGMLVLADWFAMGGTAEIAQFHALMQHARQVSYGAYGSLPFEIDGIVVRINDEDTFQGMGIVDRRPRGAIAWKFPLQMAATPLLDVTKQIGRTGVVTPVAQLQPVKIGGVTVSSASLHNWEEIKRLGIRIGDLVQVVRAGECIPKIIGKVERPKPEPNNEFCFCFLPSGNEPEFDEIETEAIQRGVGLMTCNHVGGGRVFALHKSELSKLPKDASGHYLGDDNSGHSLSQTTAYLTSWKDQLVGDWMWCHREIEIPEQIDGHPVSVRKNTDGSDTTNLYVADTHPAIARGRILNWIKKLDILTLGEEVLDALMGCAYGITPNDSLAPGDVTISISTKAPHPDNFVPFITSIASLYKLSGKKMAFADALPILAIVPVGGKKLGEKRAAKIMEEIDKTRLLTLDQFLGSLGIVHLGRRRVEMIRTAAGERLSGYGFNPLDDINRWFGTSESVGGQPVSFLRRYAEELSIPGIADEIQEDLDLHREEIDELLRFIMIKPPKAAPVGDGPLKGKTFCFTGCRATEEEIAKLIELGGEEKTGVSKELTYLVTKEKESNSSKAMKAREAGIACISLEQFREMIK